VSEPVVQITCAARTDVGVVRAGNEDNFLVVPERGIFVVADGMGGHAAGEVASDIAVRVITDELGSLRGLVENSVADRMRKAIRSANAAIFQRTMVEHDKRGMGTTATALALFSGRYLVGQVGDSRAYLLRNARFTQLTKDHSYVQEQIDAGNLTQEQARNHPYSNVITRCVGANGDVTPDIYGGVVRRGDVFVLASDGLTGMLSDDRLVDILSDAGEPQHWVDRMVNEANRRGGLDNITVVIVRIDAMEDAETDPTREMPAARA